MYENTFDIVDLFITLFFSLSVDARFAELLEDCITAVNSGANISVIARKRLIERFEELRKVVKYSQIIFQKSDIDHSDLCFKHIVEQFCYNPLYSSEMAKYRNMCEDEYKPSAKSKSIVLEEIKSLIRRKLVRITEERIEMENSNFIGTLKFLRTDTRFKPFFDAHLNAIITHGALLKPSDRRRIVQSLYNMDEYHAHKRRVVNASSDKEVEEKFHNMLHYFATHVRYSPYLVSCRWALTRNATNKQKVAIMRHIKKIIEFEFELIFKCEQITHRQICHQIKARLGDPNHKQYAEMWDWVLNTSSDAIGQKDLLRITHILHFNHLAVWEI